MKLNKKPITLAHNYLPDMKIVQRYMSKSLKAGRMSNFGPLYHLLRERLHKYLNLNPNKDILITNSCHTALMTAFHLFPVIYNRNTYRIPSYTFPSTWQAANLQGIEYDIVDVDKDGFLPESYKPQDSNVCVFPLSQIPENIESMNNAIERDRLIIDGASVFGNKGNFYNFGDAFCLSFHATKTLPVGEMGACIVDKVYMDAGYEYLNFGINKDPNIFPSSSGLNGKVPEISCAIALALLDEVNEIMEKRLDNIDSYLRHLPLSAACHRSDLQVYSIYPLYFDTHEISERVKNKLLKNNVQVRSYYQPFVSEKIAPNAYDLFQRNICMPCHPGIRPKDIKNICNIIEESI